jgi:hypothetical protein
MMDDLAFLFSVASVLPVLLSAACVYSWTSHNCIILALQMMLYLVVGK